MRDKDAAGGLKPDWIPLGVVDAGLVLVAPYLGQLYERCGISAAMTRTDRLRCVGLHGQIVWGDADPAEPGPFGLCSVLAGLSPTDVSLVDVPKPSQQEAELVFGMLGAVCDQWSSLSETSPEGLRQSFLRREGELRMGPNALELRVASGAFDMLLDQLPWPFSPLDLSGPTDWPSSLDVVWR